MNRISEKNTQWFFILLILFWLTLVVWASGLFTFVSPQFSEYTLKIISDSSNIEPVLSMIGTMLSTVLAIFFSISILVVQHAASRYTASILKWYRNDLRTWFVFSFYSVGLGLTIVAIYSQTNLYLVNITVITFAFSFLFLSTQFLHIVDIIDPRSIIKKAKQQSLIDIGKLPKRLETMVRKKRAGQKQDLTESPVFKEFLFEKDTGMLDFSKNKILQINDVILKACTRGELETAVEGLVALSEVAKKYIGVRSEYSFTNDYFMQYIYAQILSDTEIAFDNKNVELLNHIINTFAGIGLATTEIKGVFFRWATHTDGFDDGACSRYRKQSL
jgi:Predicted membrane protein (DUF2254)